MRDRDVRRRLRRLASPGGDDARREAIDRAKVELRERRPDATTKPDTRRFRAGAIPALLVAAIVAFGLSAPGRGLAEELAELVGIGDEPTEEPVFAPPDSSVNDIVIGVGRSASGFAYEVVGAQYQSGGEEPSLCFRASFPGRDYRGTLQCLTPAFLADFASDKTIATAFSGPGELGRSERTVVAGVVGWQVARVQVAGMDEREGAEIFRLTPELRAELGTEIEAGYFVALVPGSEAPARDVVVAAFDGEGELLSRETVKVSDVP